MPKVHLVKSFSFDAAHRLPLACDGHKCRNLHGHGFRFEMEFAGPVDPKFGWFLDYHEISALGKELSERLDHRMLNEIPGLEAGTSEMLAVWIWKEAAARLPGLVRVSVFETASSACHYYGEE